jgi:hypothetical protein
MKALSRKELDSLLSQSGGPCVSIFMPTHQTGSEIQQDMTRFKNLLRSAEERLGGRGMKEPEIKQLMAPAWELLESRLTWRHPNEGFAMFICGGEAKSYHLPIRFEEQVIVGDKFNVTPLLRLFGTDGRFYLLTLNQDNVRLFEGSKYSMREIEVSEMPESLAESMKFEDRQQQETKKMETGGTGMAGTNHPGITQGHGGADEQPKQTFILDFFRRIDQGLHDLLARDTAPLVLAGVEYLHPLYRQANNYPHLIDQGIMGNTELWSTKDLHDKAWNIVQPYFMTEQQRIVAQYQNLTGTGRTSDDLREVLVAAGEGRVESLFIAADAKQWGSFEQASGDFELHEGDDGGGSELIDQLATAALSNGARVFVIDSEAVPSEKPLAAVFRY